MSYDENPFGFFQAHCQVMGSSLRTTRVLKSGIYSMYVERVLVADIAKAVIYELQEKCGGIPLRQRDGYCDGSASTVS